ncbi:hypothetical protein ACSSS7_001342 [Eimeria intestinalis]
MPRLSSVILFFTPQLPIVMRAGDFSHVDKQQRPRQPSNSEGTNRGCSSTASSSSESRESKSSESSESSSSESSNSSSGETSESSSEGSSSRLSAGGCPCN